MVYPYSATFATTNRFFSLPAWRRRNPSPFGIHLTGQGETLASETGGRLRQTDSASLGRGPGRVEPIPTLFTAKASTKIASWNVRTLAQTGKATLLLKELERYGIEIAALAEIRWRNEGQQDLREGSWTLLHTAATPMGVGGVGLCFTGKAKSAWVAAGKDWRAYDTRALSARMKTQSGYATIVSVYAPTEEHQEEAEQFYATLQTIVQSAPKRDILIILGDFNARVGKDNGGYEQVMGRHAVDEARNNNGDRLIQFCQINDLVIQGTRFQHKEIHKGTWKHPGTGFVHQIDHILSNKRWMSCIEDVRVCRGADLDTDHRLLRAQVRIHFKRAPKRDRTNPWHFRRAGIQLQEEFRCRVTAALQQQPAPSTVAAKWQRIRTSVQEAMQQVTKQVEKPKRNDWISEQTMKLVEEKRRVFLRLQADDTEEHKEEYKRQKKAVQSGVRNDRKQWLEETAQRMQEANVKGDAKELFKEVRTLAGPKKSIISGLKNTDNELQTKVQEIVETFSDYFQQLLNVDSKIDRTLLEETKAAAFEDLELADLATTPTREEVFDAIRKLKPRKAAGEDGIIGEALQLGGEVLGNAIYDLIVCIWTEEVLPEEWKGGILIPIFKAGSKSNVDNYRGIALLNITSKVLTKIINNRITVVAEKRLLEQQSGFRRGRGTIEQIFNVRQVLEKHVEHQQECAMAFIDLRKAYDSVDRELMMAILRAEGVPEKLVKLIEKLYEHTTLRVRVKDELGRSVEISSGVRQGCILSPTLFNLFLNFLLKHVLPELRRRGVKLKYRIGTSLFDTVSVDTLDDADEWGFLYADDLVLVAGRMTELHDMIRIFDDVMRKAGMELSVPKTKVMMVENEAAHGALSLGARGTIQQVENFKYLGSIVAADGTTAKEVEERIKKAGAVFAMMRRNIFAPKRVQRTVKLRVYSASVLSVLLYGSETWNCTAAEIRRLETFHNACLRCICGVSKLSHTRITALRSMATETSIESKISQARLRWLGHIARMSHDRTPKKMLFARLPARRPPQKPKQRWKDLVAADLRRIGVEDTWMVDSQDRTKWRRLASEGAQQLDEEKRKRHDDSFEQKKTGCFAFKCADCFRGFVTARGLKIHRAQKHFANYGFSESEEDEEDAGDPLLVCKECGKECGSGAGLAAHKRWKHPLSKEEGKKKKTDTTTQSAKSDTSGVMSGLRQGESCPSGSASVDAAVNVGSLLCPVCGRPCRSGAGLAAHVRAHGEK